MTRTEKSGRLLVGLSVAIYLAFGVVFLVAPEWGAGLVGIELTSTTALADFRAIYGGLPMGVGIFFAAALKWRELLLPAVALTGICALEAALARAYSWLASGTPSAAMFAFALLEIGGAAWAWSVGRRLWVAPRASAESQRTSSLRTARV